MRAASYVCELRPALNVPIHVVSVLADCFYKIMWFTSVGGGVWEIWTLSLMLSLMLSPPLISMFSCEVMASITDLLSSRAVPLGRIIGILAWKIIKSINILGTTLIQTLKPMGFAHQGVWVMGYHRLMGYGVQIPAHQLGGPKKLWDFRGYGLSGAWVTRVSTVSLTLFCKYLDQSFTEL